MCNKVRLSSTLLKALRFYGLTLSIILSTHVVAILIPSVEVVFGLTGASMGLTICFLLPATLYIKLSFSSKANLSALTHAGSRQRLLYNRVLSFVVLGIVVPFGAAALVATIIDAIAKVANPAEVHCK